VQKHNTCGTYCFKNLYSAYNGIQIKYLSIDAGAELASTKKLVVKSYQPQPRPQRPFFKKKPEVDDKSITFKSNGRKRQEGQRVEGWRV
jgi:hypothetical protein